MKNMSKRERQAYIEGIKITLQGTAIVGMFAFVFINIFI